MAKMLLIYRKVVTLEELRDLANPNRGPDGIARKILVRNCAITNCPGSMEAVYATLKFEESRLAKNYFTSRSKVEYLKEPVSFDQINNPNGK